MRALLLFLCSSLIACGTQAVDDLPGAKRDAGLVERDAGIAPRDSGSPHDSGTARDAGDTTRDAGTAVDAGIEPDAGTHDGGSGTVDGGTVCTGLQRDVCLATPGCVLDGSETVDPAYFCRDARSGCEMIQDVSQCEAEGGCTYFPGACYCPEGMDCLCGGGPGPVCREICGGFAGTPCPATFYCDLPQGQGSGASVCIGNADQLGVCTPFPPTCQGAPNGDVCGCDMSFTPVDYANDCERRAAGAHRGRSGTCP